MAGVIGKINALPGLAVRSDPARVRPGESSNATHDKRAPHLDSNSVMMSSVRRTMVITHPAITISKAQVITGNGWLVPVSTALRRHATVMTAIRCCLAIGPQKYCEAP